MMSDFKIMDDTKGTPVSFGHDHLDSPVEDESKYDSEEEYSAPEEALDEEHDEPQENDSSEDEAEEERRPLKVPKTRNQIQRERIINEELARVARAEAESLRQENEILRRQAERSQNVAMDNYDRLIDRDLNQTKQKLAIAIENGDVEAQVEANSELSRLATQKHESENWKMQQQIQAERNQNQPARSETQQLPRAALDWYAQNSWANPNSPDFDHDMYSEADHIAKQLDHELSRTGQSHLIYSRAYFNKINELVDERMNPQQSMQKKELNMKPTRNNVAPVKNSGFQGNSAQSNRKARLTPEQAEFAKGLGIDEKTYLKSFLQDKVVNAHKYRGI